MRRVLSTRGTRRPRSRPHGCSPAPSQGDFCMSTTPHEKPAIVGVLRHYFPDWETPRRDSGSWQPCKCPSHDDSRASASINIEENTIYCHACDYSHDSWGVIMEEEGCDFLAAVETANRRFGEGRYGLPSTADTRQPRRQAFGEPRNIPGQRAVFPARVRRRPNLGP
ncbi:CHC2 zinc finger domain-containing protein [Streptomyces sp. NPDC057654]|uniref:CHC2 zinc finger domain-containing protein n=1 Tax=Streptomyces sp. NPDC057654 TaxID=3346196 RepID=UPI0036CFDCA2